MDPIGSGSYVQWHGLVATVLEVSGQESFIKVDSEANVRVVLTSELIPLRTRSLELDVPLEQINDKKWEKASCFAAAFRNIRNDKKRTDYVDAISKNFDVSTRTVWRKLARFEADPTVSALVERSPGRRPGSRYLDVKVERIIQDEVQNKFLVEEEPDLTLICDHIQTVCRVHGLKPPCEKTVRNRVLSIESYHAALKRKGKKKADEKFSASPGHLEVGRPLEEVQIDHTLADVILVSDDERREPIGRPWLTFAIDVASRCVVGFHVTFDAPSSTSVAHCLLTLFMPKRRIFGDVLDGDITMDWPCSGTPTRIHSDNGRDFHALALKRGCEQRGIDLQFRPVKKPKYGGHIERLIGTFMGRLRLLPGTTKSSVKELGDYKCEKKSCMTLAEFRTWLIAQITTQYHQKVHRGIGVPPIYVWNRSGIKEASDPTQEEALRFLVDFLPSQERLIKRTGIEYRGLFYWSDELAPFVGDGVLHRVCEDKEVTHIYVPISRFRVIVAACTKATTALTWAEWDEQKARLRRIGQSNEYISVQDEGRLYCSDLVKASSEATRKARRKHQRVKESRDYSAVVKQRLMPSQPVQAVVEEEELPTLENVIPYPLLELSL